MNESLDQQIYRTNNSSTVTVFSVIALIVVGIFILTGEMIAALLAAIIAALFITTIVKLSSNTIEITQNSLKFKHTVLSGAWTSHTIIPRSSVIGVKRSINGQLNIETTDGRKYQLAIGAMLPNDVTAICKIIENDINKYHSQGSL